jgi:hypothetical protein
MSNIEALIKELPPDLQQEVEDFVQFLLEKRVRKPSKQIQLDWRGAMRDLSGQYSSVELQHKLLDFWNE